MKRKWSMIAAIIGIFLIGLVAVGPIMSEVETPNYEIVDSQGNIEIRHYDPMIIAEVQMEGKREEAIGDGFRLLADYIFGCNTVQQDISMTAPVQQQASKTITMTAPVQQQEDNGIWNVSFVMPSKYTMQTLPKPSNENVTLKEIPTKQFIVIRFSGTNSNENLKEHEKQLMDYVKANNIQVSGLPKYAFYNPPWTLPPMRRNEILLEISNNKNN